ncbi:MAG: family 1 glycosylhydrolase [Myxococcota bacterium]|nr:family 1 glycosylhydrolase [Myxococcota bacterium]
MVRSGHHDRIDDLDLIASLGVTRVRYPILWERTLSESDWTWAAQRLERLRALGVGPIVTLLHHGSGPSFTSLVDDSFPTRFAAYARAVATRFPWVDDWTPINEPLTTARFSGLYGFWYPHGRDEATFQRALENQCKGIALAMQEIRAINPRARLIQTEDLGFTHSTPALAYQAKYDNRRRWLSMDLLWEYGARPDILGFNYYVTSERFLDENLERWPAWSHGGNGRDRYADIHSVLAGRTRGVDVLLAEAHARYHVPVALTEVHMGCTREEQLRWLVQIYDRVTDVRQRIPVVAMTAWSTFGAFDWHCLVTREEGRYEPGLFDTRSATPRPTALATAWRAIARGERPSHPVIEGHGWWQRTVQRDAEAA